jgi:dipeptidyl aminopeptidase/acylaminoacyl peptidase
MIPYSTAGHDVRQARTRGKPLVLSLATSLSLALALFGCLAGSAAAGPALPDITSKSLTELASLSAVTMSPDGRYAAFRLDQPDSGSNSWRISWMLLELADGKVRRLADAGDAIEYGAARPDPEAPQWSPDSQKLYFRRAVEGKVDIWSVHADGSNLVRVTSGERYIADFAVQPDAGNIAFRAGPRNADVIAAEEMDFREGTVQEPSVLFKGPLVRGQYFRGRLATARIGRDDLYHGISDEAEMKPEVLEQPGGAVRPATAAEAEAYRAAGGATDADHRTIEAAGGVRVVAEALPLPPPNPESMSTPRPEFRMAWHRGSRTVTCTDAVCTGRSVTPWQVADDGTVLFSNRDELGRAVLYGWDPERQQVRERLRIGGAATNWRIAEYFPYTPWCPRAGDRFICILSQPASPERLVSVDPGTGQVRTLYDPNPGFAERVAAVAEVSDISWKSGGREWPGMLVLPKNRGTAPLPLFVTTYGTVAGGFLRGGMAEELPLYSLVESGIAVLYVDNKTALQETWPGKYALTVQSIAAAIRKLAAEKIIDPKRVGAGGHSFGSETVGYGLMYADIFAAASVNSPATLDPTIYFFYHPGTKSQESMKLQWWGSLPSPNLRVDPEWRRVSMALNVTHVRAPLLMQMPEEEMPSALQLWTAMHENKRPYELVGFSGEPHQKHQPAHKRAVYERNLDWFRFWLQDQEDPAEEKRAQYVRWHGLRELRDAVAKLPSKPKPAPVLPGKAAQQR